MGNWLWTALATGLGLAALLWFLHHEAESVVLARVWRPSAPDFEFPELVGGSGLKEYLLKRKNFGIAVAGGGSRGMAVAHGAVRTLRQAGILDEARYLSTTSGSVWFGVPLYYQSSDSLDDFLGESLAPGDLTPEVLTSERVGTFFNRLSFFRRFPKGFKSHGEEELQVRDDPAGLRGAAVTSLQPEELARRRRAEADWGLPSGMLDRLLGCVEGLDLCACLVEKAFPDSSLRELWNIVTSYAFMHPFGLATPYSSHCHETQLERARSRLGNRTRIYVARDMSQGLPFLLSQSAILAPFTGRDGRPVAAFPLENSPLYAGTPSSYSGSSAYPYKAVGDILVEPFAWPGEAMERIPDTADSEVKVKRRPHLVNVGQLAEWAAIATSYFADFQVRDWTTRIPRCAVALVEQVMPHVALWSPLGGLSKRGVPASEIVAVGDAGIYDDLGHIPLLRRRVSQLLIYDSSAVHDNSTGTDKEDLCQMVYTLAAFGQPGCLNPPSPAGASNPTLHANFLTVFKPSEFQPFWQKVVALYKAGEPAVIRGNFTVVDNAYLGITGGWQAEVIWVIALPLPPWKEALPTRTAQALRSFFPNYFAAEMFSRLEMSAVSQFASWMTEKAVLREVRAMLGVEHSHARARQGIETA